MAISKRNMAARVAKAAEATPGLEDRLRHAQEIAHLHPAGDHELPAAQSLVDDDSAQGHSAARFAAVPIDLIDPNPHNARRIYRPERVSELAASIGMHGQDVPGIATPREDRFILVAGHYRLRALKVLGAKFMNLMVHDTLSDRDLFGYSYRENAEREGQTALDNALCWRELLDKRLFASETDLAEATGLSLPTINKTLRILKLSPAVLDVVGEDPAMFALSALYELALFQEMADEMSAIGLAKLIKTGEAGRKEVQEARAALENPKRRKSKETSRPYKIHRDGSFIGSLKVWDSGRVMLDVVLADASERDQVLAEIKIRFGVLG